MCNEIMDGHRKSIIYHSINEMNLGHSSICVD